MVNEATPPQWAPDPYGRHQMRYWDGSAWTEHVVDDNLPSRDPLVVPPATSYGGAAGFPEPVGSGDTAVGEQMPWGSAPASRQQPVGAAHGVAAAHAAPSSEPKPLMSGKMHALLALFTCGLWLLIAPAIYWLRKGAYKPAAVWVTACVVLVGVSVATGGPGSDGSVTTSSQPTATGTAQGLLGGATAKSTSPTKAKTTAAAKPSSTAKPTPRTTSSSTTPRKTSAKPKTTSTTKKTTAPKTDPRFDTCKAANAAGYGNYRRGVDAEYAWYQDRDDDGVVCEF